MPDLKTRVGFIGLGMQGGPMAQRIIEAGYPVTVWARRPEALEPFVAAGARAVGNPAEVARNADVVGLCVFNDADTIEVFDKLAPGLARGAIVAIHATVRPDTCQALEARARAQGVGLIDAPVSGGAEAARKGALAIMVGGDAKLFEACRPVFSTFAKSLTHVGGIGAGQQTKIVNNALMIANFALAHSTISVGVASGLDRATLNDVIAASSGQSLAQSFYAKLPNLAPFAQNVPLMRKDVGLFADMGRDRPRTKAVVDLCNAFLDSVEDAAARKTRGEPQDW